MDDDEFERQLHQLIAKAHENDVSLLGCYNLRTGEANDRTLQLEVTEVASDNRSWLLSRLMSAR